MVLRGLYIMYLPSLLLCCLWHRASSRCRWGRWGGGLALLPGVPCGWWRLALLGCWVGDADLVEAVGGLHCTLASDGGGLEFQQVMGLLTPEPLLLL